MIKQIEKVIGLDNKKLSFLKVSTPASGKNKNGKVIIFVFEEGKAEPTLCVKTVRFYGAKEVVIRNHENLKKLVETAEGSIANLFARPLRLHDDGKNIFCVESVCSGEKFSTGSRDVGLVFEKYVLWQEALSKKTKKFFRGGDLLQLLKESISKLSLPKEAEQFLENYFKNLSLQKNIALPALVQHGDLTPDNVLISGKEIFFVDYDYTQLTEFPGFDFFHFLSKSRIAPGSFSDQCDKCFSQYFKNMGATVSPESLKAIFFIYYIIESIRKGTGAKKTGQEIVSDFEALMKR